MDLRAGTSHRFAFTWVVVLSALLGCDGGPDGDGDVRAVDASVSDGMGEERTDASLDGGDAAAGPDMILAIDAMPDGTLDAMSDAAPDSAPDAMPDAMSDAVVDAASAPLVEVSITPGWLIATVGESHRLTLQGRSADGRSAPVVEGVVWAVEPEEIASVSADGMLEARRPGRATVAAAVGDLSAESLLLVEPAPFVELLIEPDAVVTPAGRALDLRSVAVRADGERIVDPEVEWRHPPGGRRPPDPHGPYPGPGPRADPQHRAPRSRPRLTADPHDRIGGRRPQPRPEWR